MRGGGERGIDARGIDDKGACVCCYAGHAGYYGGYGYDATGILLTAITAMPIIMMPMLDDENGDVGNHPQSHSQQRR